MTETLLLLTALLAPLLLLSVTRRWHIALFAAMFMAVFEGALRKWVFPGFQNYIYFLKDALLLLAVLGFAAQFRYPGIHEKQLGGLKFLLVLMGLYCFIQIANPYSPSLLLGIVGFKSYMLYALLLMLVPYAFTSHEDVEARLRTFMLFMVPVAILGLIQFASPADSFINRYAQDTTNIARFGANSRVRASGTFAYIGGYTTFVIAMFNLSAAFVLAGYGGIRRNAVAYALLASTTLAVFTTGSRTAILGTIGMLPIFIGLAGWAGLIQHRMMIRMIIASVLISALAVTVASGAVDAFTYRAATADMAADRITSPLSQTIAAIGSAPLLGLGIGSTHNSAAAIMGTNSLWWLDGNTYEDEPARIVVEIGLPGLVLVMAVRIILLLWAIRLTRALKTPLFRLLSGGVAIFIALHMHTQVINNPTAGMFFWFSAGLLFAMYRLDYSRHVVASKYAASPPRRSRHILHLSSHD